MCKWRFHDQLFFVGIRSAKVIAEAFKASSAQPIASDLCLVVQHRVTRCRHFMPGLVVEKCARAFTVHPVAGVKLFDCVGTCDGMVAAALRRMVWPSVNGGVGSEFDRPKAMP